MLICYVGIVESTLTLPDAAVIFVFDIFSDAVEMWPHHPVTSMTSKPSSEGLLSAKPAQSPALAPKAAGGYSLTSQSEVCFFLCTTDYREELIPWTPAKNDCNYLVHCMLRSLCMPSVLSQKILGFNYWLVQQIRLYIYCAKKPSNITAFFWPGFPCLCYYWTCFYK